MADAFLHRRSIFDKHKDAYGFKNPIKQMRVARSWDNPITRRKREKGLHDWVSSFAGKRHYRKLSRHNAIHLHEDNMNRVPIEEICDALNRYATARWLPFKADLLQGTDGKHISLHGGHVYLDIGYAPSGELEVYDAEAARPLNVLTHWDSVDEIAGHLLGLAVRQAAKNESVYEKLRFEKGHKDSKGNDAPWVIRSHEDDKVLASFANKDDAVQHLARMKNYSKRESVMKNWSVNVLWRSPAGFERTTRVLVRADSKEAAGREAEKYVRREVGSVDTVARDIKEYVEESCSLRETLRKLRTERYLTQQRERLVPAELDAITKDDFEAYKRVQMSGQYNMIVDAEVAMADTGLDDSTYWGIIKHYGELANKYGMDESLKKSFRFRDPKSDDDLVAIQDIVYEINRRNESQAVAEKIGSELESLMESASRDPKWNEMSDEECASAMYKAAQPILSKITSEQLGEIFSNPGHDHEYFCDVIEYDEEAEGPEYRADDLYDFSSIRHESKNEGRFTEIKAAIKAAWSAAEVKWFRLDFQESTERLDVYPIASDNEGVVVNWGVLPERNTIVQYATDFRTGNSEIEREMPYKDLDELEKIFVDEFKAMDETLEIGAENGADIHPLTEKNEGAASFSHVWELQAQQAKETLEELTKRFGDADRLAFEIRNFPHTQECGVVVTIDGNPFITVEFEGGSHGGVRWHCFDDDVDDMRLDASDENAAKNMVLRFKDDILDALESLYGFGTFADEDTQTETAASVPLPTGTRRS